MNSAHGPFPYTRQTHIEDETLTTGDFDSSSRPSSPLMKPLKVDKYASSEPAGRPKITQPPISFDNTLPPIETLRSGDPQLLDQLGNGRNPEIPRFAEFQPLVPIEDECEIRGWHGHPRGTPDPDSRGGAGRRDRKKDESLLDIAKGALAAAESPGQQSRRSSAIDISDSTRELSLQDDRSRNEDELSDFRLNRMNGRTSISMQPGDGLPPIMPPDSGVNGRSLPPISSITNFGEMKHSSSDHGVRYPHSPPPGPPLSQFPPLSASRSHGSPPISPPDSYQRSLPSPRPMSASSPYNPYISTQPHIFTPEYSTTPVTAESTGSEQGGTAPTGERLYINGTYGSSTQPPVYPCDYPSCKAPPFQTQYLLNSHANVHSQSRPHYCPVSGCSRSEGGKGFKRKNEMIRHGLVHESPGYICPFCPEKDHRYPRPDNLQRHVRVHHPDKNKDDPQLREVLALRPDGPSRGRRRRGGA